MTHRIEPYTAEELRAWRARAHLHQAEVAKLFGVSQRAISNWEDGRLPKLFSEMFERVLIDWCHREKTK